jgi:hypothetical protein
MAWVKPAEDEFAPGRFGRAFQAVPEGTVLRAVFVCLLGMAIAIVGLDYYQMTQLAADTARTARTEPLPLELPKPGDQIRPYLPRTIPVGPDRGEPTLPGYDGPVDGEAMSAPMRFIAAPDGVVTAIGRIDPGTANLLKALLDRPGERVRTLVVHSPGGSVSDAITMARLLRERKIDTLVPADGYCASPAGCSGWRARAPGSAYTRSMPCLSPARNGGATSTGRSPISRRQSPNASNCWSTWASTRKSGSRR